MLGHSRQAFYKKKTDGVEKLTTERKILDTVHEIREIDPGIGGVKLWLILSTMFGSGRMPGRDAFLGLLRRHQLMQKPRRSRWNNTRSPAQGQEPPPQFGQTRKTTVNDKRVNVVAKPPRKVDGGCRSY